MGLREVKWCLFIAVHLTTDYGFEPTCPPFFNFGNVFFLFFFFFLSFLLSPPSLFFNIEKHIRLFALKKKPTSDTQCAVLSRFSRVQLFATLWTVACQAPLSMEFSRQEYWSGLPFHKSKILKILANKILTMFKKVLYTTTQ